MRTRSIAATTVCALACWFPLAGAPASASLTHSFLGYLGTPGAPLEFPTDARDIAVDRSTGNVYVYDRAAGGEIHKFDAAGEPAEFTALGSDWIGGVGEDVTQIAVDSSGGPAGGDIYVARVGSTSIPIYRADGSLLAELSSVGAPPGPAHPTLTCGLTVGPMGDVYVGRRIDEGGDSLTGHTFIDKFTPTANPVVPGDYRSALQKRNVASVCRLAADGEGNVYVGEIDGSIGGPIMRFEASEADGTLRGGMGIGDGTGLAVDQSTGDT
jgi:hypothetical protein